MTRARTALTCKLTSAEISARLRAGSRVGPRFAPPARRVARDLNEECGVFGVFGVENAAPIAALGLHALQHRGQESVGLATYDGARFHTERRLGLVAENFSREEAFIPLAGTAAIGHVRYSTQGETVLRNVQPLYADLSVGGLAVANNGNLTNSRTLREELVEKGCIFQSTTDTELFLQLTAISQKAGLRERFLDALRQVEGAYAVVALGAGVLIGARDPVGIRPLVLGVYDGKPVLCSETCALDAIGADFVRDIEPGEVVWCADGRIESHYLNPKRPVSRVCAFEYVYFARADSFVDGRSVYDVRKELGAILAQECPVAADVVSPVPDTSTPAALGYAEALSIDFEFGLIKNNYVGRTFIQPTQQARDMDVSRKHAANRARLDGKRVVLVDDSIVRGTTSRKVVNMVRAAGAREVHMRVASPPIRFPCYYGIDMPSRDKLIAAHHSVEEMRDMIGVDSLGFLSVNGLYKATGFEARDAAAPQLTDHYFTGDYPTRLVDLDRSVRREARELQLTFLAEAS